MGRIQRQSTFRRRFLPQDSHELEKLASKQPINAVDCPQVPQLLIALRIRLDPFLEAMDYVGDELVEACPGALPGASNASISLGTCPITWFVEPHTPCIVAST